MAKGRILYVNQEITPFVPENENSIFGRFLPARCQELGRDIRVFMPRYSTVSDRKNQLHEVIRLSGMNLIINNCDHQLIIKVGSIPTARMQVYFIDNEEYFAKGTTLLNERKVLMPETDERMLFFGRGTLEAVRKLAWQPHLVHFTGWFSSMVPFYLRRINKENGFYKDTKTVFTITNDAFKGQFVDEMVKKMKTDGATAKDVRLFETLDYIGLCKAAITYANGVVIASPKANKELVAFAKENKNSKFVLDYNSNQSEFFEQINRLYDTLIGGSINN